MTSMSTSKNPKFPPIPPSFTAKKTSILSLLSTPSDTYTDKSPKGSVDAPIIDLIDEINAIDGLFTTSSCSGRVAVFVEGPKAQLTGNDRVGGGKKAAFHAEDDDDDGDDRNESNEGETAGPATSAAVTGSPAGKGGGHWLYVSHDPVNIPNDPPPGFYAQLCGFSSSAAAAAAVSLTHRPPRLIRLIFSPLILHIQAATLHHAKPLLAAAINAGFRESGVQSLKSLDDLNAGVTVGIRTNGLGFESVIGFVREGEDGGEECVCVVDEGVLGVMFQVVNERFMWNVRRRERLRGDILRGFGVTAFGVVDGGWEDREVRRVRMREEGLKRREMVVGGGRNGVAVVDHDGGGNGGGRVVSKQEQEEDVVETGGVDALFDESSC